MTAEHIRKMDLISHRILPIILIVVEYIAVIIAEWVSLKIQHSFPFPNGKFYLLDGYFYVTIPLIYIFFMKYTKADERFILFWETMKRTFYAVLYSEMFCIIVLYIFKDTGYLSRSFIIIFFVVSYLSIYLSKQILIKVCNYFDIMKEPVLFIGGGKTTEDIIYFCRHNNCFGIKVVGIVDNNIHPNLIKSGYRTYEDITRIKEYIQDLQIETVLVAKPNLEKVKLLELTEEIQPLVRNLMFVPNTVGMPVYNLEVKKLYESNMLILSIKNNLTQRHNYIMKRIFDLVLSTIGLIIVIPVGFIISCLIIIDSPGAAPIFRHYRVGKDGKSFPCYKFRSMVPNAQDKLKDYLATNPQAQAEWESCFKLKDDPRITKVGKFIRKTSLDELPQVLNVLKGEMSLVGPRPIVTDELRYYGKHVKDYYSVLPGITGMWQANGRSDTDYDERVALDVWYVRNWSIWIDIALICKTIKTVFCGKGAY